MNSVINKNRVVTITRTDNPNKTWHTALADIINLKFKKDTNGESIISSDFSANAGINLLMTNEFPKFKIDNEFTEGISSLVSNTSASVKKESKKTWNFLDTIFQGAKVVDAASDALTSDVGETGSSWNPWFANVPTWKSSGSSLLSFSYKFDFAMGQYGWWNAKEEVVKPILNLIAPTLPQEITSFHTSGPAPQVVDLMANIVKHLGEAADEKTLGDALQALVLERYFEFTYTLKFGNFITFNNVLIKKAECDFSSDVDDHGFPISGSALLEFTSIMPPGIKTNVSSSDSRKIAAAIKFGGNY